MATIKMYTLAQLDTGMIDQSLHLAFSNDLWEGGTLVGKNFKNIKVLLLVQHVNFNDFILKEKKNTLSICFDTNSNIFYIKV